jgi:nucleotide-binding universal stress UspA family protein
VTDRPADRLRIVVGVDGSDPSSAALQRASVEAAAHGAVLEIVHAWNFLDQPGDRFDPEYGEEKARAKVTSFVDGALGADRPDTVIRLINDNPAPALLDAAQGAFTLVVGARGLGGFKGLLLGSVGQHVISHAPCPVLVVR